MSHVEPSSAQQSSRRARLRSNIRRAAIVGSAVVCLAALGVRSDARLHADGPQTSWVMHWLAPVRETAGLMNAVDPTASWSDSAIDAASLLVLGLSLIGGGRIIRRLRRNAARHPELADQAAASRAPMASSQVGPRRMAR